MLNQHAVESLYSATYVEDYMDSTENLPDDVMKKLTIMKEMDVDFQRHLSDLECQMKILLESLDARKESASKIKIQNILISAQDKGDEKLQIVQQIQDFVDNKVRQLELDEKNLEFGKDIDNDSRHDTSKISEISDRPVKRARRARHEVFVPSILGPSTLEATSYNPESSVNAAAAAAAASAAAAAAVLAENHHHNTKSSNQSHSVSSSTHNVSSSTPTSTTTPTIANSAHVSHSASNAQPSSSSAHTETVERSTKHSSVNNHANEEKSTYSSTSNTTTNANTSSSTTTTPKKQTSSRKETQEKKVKRRKTNKQSDNSPPNIPIDPDEPTYCLCDQVSYGEMIGCDNDLCPIEWFHFTCVQLSTKPKGKWYCPKCRGDRPNVMKPKAIFLKELEKYNREKEEKS